MVTGLLNNSGPLSAELRCNSPARCPGSVCLHTREAVNGHVSDKRPTRGLKANRVLRPCQAVVRTDLAA
jgi:hypothetical protein